MKKSKFLLYTIQDIQGMVFDSGGYYGNSVGFSLTHSSINSRLTFWRRSTDLYSNQYIKVIKSPAEDLVHNNERD